MAVKKGKTNIFSSSFLLLLDQGIRDPGSGMREGKNYDPV
jgi:hypothetical protein